MDFMFPYIGNVIIPTYEVIFFRGVGIPPTRTMMHGDISSFTNSPHVNFGYAHDISPSSSRCGGIQNIHRKPPWIQGAMNSHQTLEDHTSTWRK